MAGLVVLDTNVLFAGLWSRTGASFRLLDLVLVGKVRPALSVPLVLEYEMVLKREAPALGLTEAEIDAILDYMCSLGHHQLVHFLWRPSLKDPRDELVLELAVAAGCSHIISHNAKDFVGSEGFGVRCVTPAEFLRHLGEKP